MVLRLLDPEGAAATIQPSTQLTKPELHFYQRRYENHKSRMIFFHRMLMFRGWLWRCVRCRDCTTSNHVLGWPSRVIWWNTDIAYWKVIWWMDWEEVKSYYVVLTKYRIWYLLEYDPFVIHRTHGECTVSCDTVRVSWWKESNQGLLIAGVMSL
jgi:hypothetical protein